MDLSEINEVKLPGVGVRFEFQTAEGKRIGVISHRTGLREVYVSRPEDPDEFKRVLGLSPDDARTLAELLGATRVAQQLADLQQRIEGLVIDWLPMREDSFYVGRTIGDARIRTRTGVSVVAIVRGDDAVPAPGPEQRLESGDYLVVVGTARGVEDAVELLRAG
ncbi:MAG TPA: cation:proton antiporter regulatory subunit [Actinomycetota bacterium]|nr:cation:proton antiporter regulatory subunit [Actinomycetota bacterium]